MCISPRTAFQLAQRGSAQMFEKFSVLQTKQFFLRVAQVSTRNLVSY